MIQAKSGMMCLNCGHAESAKPASTALVPSDMPAAPTPVLATGSPASLPTDDVTAAVPSSNASTVDVSVPDGPAELSAADSKNSLEDQVKHDLEAAIAAVGQKSEFAAEAPTQSGALEVKHDDVPDGITITPIVAEVKVDEPLDPLVEAHEADNAANTEAKTDVPVEPGTVVAESQAEPTGEIEAVEQATKTIGVEPTAAPTVPVEESIAEPEDATAAASGPGVEPPDPVTEVPTAPVPDAAIAIASVAAGDDGHGADPAVSESAADGATGDYAASAPAPSDKPMAGTPSGDGASAIIKTSGTRNMQDMPVDALTPRGRMKGTLNLKPSQEIPPMASGGPAVDSIAAGVPAIGSRTDVVSESSEASANPSAEEPIAPALALSSVSDGTPAHTVDHAAQAAAQDAPDLAHRAQPAPAPADASQRATVPSGAMPEPSLVAASVPTAPVPTPIVETSKAPLVATTHASASNVKTVMMVVAALMIVTAASVGAYILTAGGKTTAKKVGQSPAARMQEATTDSSSRATVLDASITPTPTATPESPLDASAVNKRDLQRKTDMAAYAAAVKAGGSNGFYATTPPSFSQGANDPTTGQPYALAARPATALGDVEYRAGGQCMGPGVTPGKSATRYVALLTKLESDPTPYCLDVK